MKGLRVGYIRVSCVDQNIDRQLDNVMLDKKFIDKASGRDTNRPQFKIMMEFLREGDRLIVHSMDRLGRNLLDLKKIVTTLNSKGIEIEFVKEALIFTGEDSSMSKLLLAIMGAFAEFELSLISERQREGIEAAKARGTYNPGRRKVLSPDQVKELKEMIEKGMKKSWIAKQFNIQRSSVYNYLK